MEVGGLAGLPGFRAGTADFATLGRATTRNLQTQHKEKPVNLKNIGFAAAIANQAWKYLRDQNDKRERDIYQSLLDNLKDGKLDDIHEKFDADQLQELYGAARARFVSSGCERFGC